jgi:hypothetical protein
MTARWTYAVALAAALLMAGCSSDKSEPAASAPAEATSAEASAPSTKAAESQPDIVAEPLPPGGCANVNIANGSLIAVGDPAANKSAADTMLQYNPPPAVADAINHFVEVGGLKADDPDWQKNSDLIEQWIKAVCPD